MPTTDKRHGESIRIPGQRAIDKMMETHIAAIRAIDPEMIALRESNARLLAALRQSVRVSKAWHNMGVKDGSPNDVWQIYYDNAPEMALIRIAIKAATP
jgi:hypothetical protein